MITGIDHIVLTVRDIDKSVAFYKRVLGVDAVTFGGGRRALVVVVEASAAERTTLSSCCLYDGLCAWV